MTTAPGTPRVAIWGTFDVANFGDHLFPRIFAHELERRLPGCSVQPFSPLGHLHPLPIDGGAFVEPLGNWSERRLSEIARAYDLVAIGGGEIIHMNDDVYAGYYGTSVDEARLLRPSAFFIEGLGADLERTCPVAWHTVGVPFDLEDGAARRVKDALSGRTYISVREERSRTRLLDAGVEAEIQVVPDSAFLVERIFTEDQLGRRVRYLRSTGSYPEDARPLVIQGSRALLPVVAEIAHALEHVPDVPVVLLETGQCHGDAEFADALVNALSGRPLRMPPHATIEDIVAAIVHARGFAGISLHGSIIALASGVPNAILDLSGYSKLEGMARLVGCEHTLVQTSAELTTAVQHLVGAPAGWSGLGNVVTRLDAHFDRLAALAQESAERRPATADASAYQSLNRGFEARGRRLVEQRLRLGAEIETLENQVSELSDGIFHLNERVQALEQESAEARKRAAEAREDAAEAREDAAEAREGAAAARQEAAEARSELKRLRATKTFRYTALLRAAYARIRGFST